MTHNLVICGFSEQRYMILNLRTCFGTPGIYIHICFFFNVSFYKFGNPSLLTSLSRDVNCKKCTEESSFIDQQILARSSACRTRH